MVDASLGFGVGGDAKKRMQLHQSLLAALVGMWHPEMHSFHLLCGEMALTLLDVY
jgi:hypothetical protein